MFKEQLYFFSLSILTYRFDRVEVNLISQDPVKGKENRHHINEAGSATIRHMTVSTLQEKNDDLVPISSDSDMEIVGLTDASKQLVNRSKVRVKKKKKKKKEFECLTVDDLISPASVDIQSITECFGDSRETSKGTSLSRAHYRESSPLRRSGRSRVISRSPLRKYKSPARARSPFRPRSRSPLSRSRSPVLRRSPRRIRSPKRSRSPAYGSPARTTSRKLTSRFGDSAPSSRAYVDRYGDVTRKLLKKVNSVSAQASESSVDRSKEHQPASLREKLSNMMKRAPGSGDGGNSTHRKEKAPTNVYDQPIIIDADDEEDLALLRQKALETKQKNKPHRTGHPTQVMSQRKPRMIARETIVDDDQDEEDLQLRMIALRSAVMKKHQNRVQRGVQQVKSKRAMSKKMITTTTTTMMTMTAMATAGCSENSFTQSFIENIPIPGDELLKFASPPYTPPALCDSNHIEDMDLDTDVEREKEKLPYSPTDKITADVPIDAELLGIELSDVSFINLNDANNSPIYVVKDEQRKSSLLPVNVSSSYLLPQPSSSPRCFADSPSPRYDDDDDDNGGGGGGVSFYANRRELSSYLGGLHDSVECDLIDGICCREGTYLSTSVPAYEEKADPPVTRDLPISAASSNHVLESVQSGTTEQRSNGDPLTRVNSASDERLNGDVLRGNKRVCETASKYPVTDSPTASALGSASPNGSMVTLDDLPEKGADPSSPDADGNSPPVANCIPSEEEGPASRQAAGVTTQDASDVATKDVNKIPTLINRTLVPAPILKSNKWLQQPLPRKHETPHPAEEPTFKSAEMQPVIVTAEAIANISNTFKPIKLVMPFSKKPQTVLTTPIEFNDSANEGLENASKNDDPDRETAVPGHPATDTQTADNDNAALTRKKQKRIKKSRRKNLDVEKSLAVKNEISSCTNNDVNKNVNIIETAPVPQRRIAECDRGKGSENERTRESPVENRESSSVQDTAAAQKSLLSSIESSDIKSQNASDIKRNNHECVSASNEEAETKHITSSISGEEKRIESSHCLPAKFNDTAAPGGKNTEVTKENDNRRQSIDENEDELRAILLASLAKRTTKSSDTSSTSTVITASSTTMNSQPLVQKTLMSTVASSAINTTTSNNNVPMLSSTLNSQEVSDATSNKTAKDANNDKSVSSLCNDRKRPNVTAKGPPKKTMKKTPAPAISTKTTSNAKKQHQNNMVQQQQRKLNNLQKHDANVNACNDKTKAKQDKQVWPVGVPVKTSTKIHAPEIQPIVIKLGSSDTDSESETERRKDDVLAPNASAQDLNSDFEKSLHKFLRDMRKEQESAAASKPVLSPQATRRDTSAHMDPKASSNMHTPLVRRYAIKGSG